VTAPEVDAASAPTVALPSLRLGPGALIGDRYEILSALGEGGMGAVFRVLDRELREEIALKVLRVEIADAPGMLDRFRREVKLARRVTHPNVARTFDLGTWNGARYLTMELVAGESLSVRFPRGHKAPLTEVLRIAAEVARGLAAAHAVGVVHRDLKPDNVLLANERVVITDFGIARLAERDPAVAGTVGSIVGTPAYMAPEQLEGADIDGRADVYALGLVMWELLCGAPAFVGDTLYSLAAARLKAGPAPDPRTVEASLPAKVAELIVDLLARAPEHRPDAQTVVERLDALRGGIIALPDRAPRLPSGLDLARSALAAREPRTIAVLPLTPVDEPSKELTAELSEALSDAVAGMRGMRVLPAAKVRAQLQTAEADPVALGRALGAGLVVEGTARVSGAEARARVRLVDVERSSIAWATRVAGKVDDPFALEDEFVSGVTSALRAREGEHAGHGGPLDPAVRAIFDRASKAYANFSVSFVREAIAILEEGLAAHPDEPWLTSLLGAALARQWVQLGSSDRDMIARAEELSLRALAIDASIAETFHTIAMLRFVAGDMRAAVRGFQETLTRAPLHASAHLNLGRVLCETGFVEQGLERLELARRIDPQLLLTYFELARTRALMGDRRAADVALDEAVARGGELAAVFPRLRLLTWWPDPALARRVATTLESSKTGAIWERALPMVQHMAEGEFWPSAIAVFDDLAEGARSAPQHRAFMLALKAEYLGAFSTDPPQAGRGYVHSLREETLQTIEQAAALPFVDVLWLDRCPALASVRDDPRFVRARAVVAARAAAVWS